MGAARAVMLRRVMDKIVQILICIMVSQSEMEQCEMEIPGIEYTEVPQLDWSLNTILRYGLRWTKGLKKLSRDRTVLSVFSEHALVTSDSPRLTDGNRN
jgi:uracil phosphoribosyltransferase